MSDTTVGLEQPPRRHRFPDGHLGWLVTGYAAGRAILADPRFSQRPLRAVGGIDDGGFQEALSGPESAGDLLRIDPPDHTRLRRLQTGYLTVRRVAEHREAVEGVVAACLDGMEEAGRPVDLVEMFAYPVPSLVLCDLLGVARSERARFERPTGVLVDYAGSSPEQKKLAMDEFYAYIRGVIEEKRVQPGDDMLSELIAIGELSDDELAGVAFFLFAGGHHTTATMLSLSAFFLLSERERWEVMRSDPAGIDRAVEELLRYLNPINDPLPRTALEDVEIEGVVIKAGETVALLTAQPSGDPDRVEDLGRFDPSRDPATGHLAFGHGRHMCLGQHLARLELQVALEGLMRRFPTLHLATAAADVPLRRYAFPEHGGNPDLHGVEHLLVSW
jgi:cytochrome P450